MKNKTLIYLIRGAVIAALYFCLTMLLSPISFGTIQFRLAESLALLPFLFPEASVGLAVGCALANLSSPFGLLDVLGGAVVTLIAGFLTSRIKNIWLAGLPSVLLNAFLVPLIWVLCGDISIYWINVLSMLLSQTVAVYVLGVPLTKGLYKMNDKVNF